MNLQSKELSLSSLMNEKVYSVIFNQANIAFELYDENEELIDINQACLEVLGVRNISEARVFNFLKDPNLSNTHKELLKRGKTVKFTSIIDSGKITRINRKNLHKLIHIELQIFPIQTNDTKAFSGYFVHIYDITRYKKMKEGLMLFEQKTRNIYNSSPLGMLQYQLMDDGQLVFLEANPAADEIFGGETNQFVGKTIEQMFPSLIKADLSKIYHRITKTDYEQHFEPIFFEDEQIKGIYELNAYQIKPTRVIVSFRDTTEIILSKRKIEENEKRFKALSEASYEGILIHNKGEILDTNQVFLDFFGYEYSDLPEINVYDLITPESRETVYYQINEGREEPYEVLAIKKDGSIFPIEIRRRCIPYQNSVVEVVAARDLTQQKIAEEALRESEAKYASILRAAPVGIGLVNDRGLVYLSDHALKMFGYSQDELIGKSTEILYATKEEFERVNQKIYPKMIKTGFEIYNTRGKRKDGEIIDVHVHLTPTDPTNPSGEVTFTIQDITEQIHTERLLRESKTQYSSILRAAPVGIGVLQNRVFIYVSDFFLNIVGYSRNELIGQSTRILYPSKEDYERIGEEVYLDMKKDGVEEFEVQLKRKDGQIIDVQIRLTPTDPNDLSAGITFIALDITDWKKAENELRLSEERLRHFLESSNYFIAIFDSNFNYIEVNKPPLKQFGLTREEIIGKHITEINPEIQPRLKHYERVIKTGRPFSTEVQYQGRIYSVEAFQVGEGMGMISSDITETREMQELLKLSEEKYRLIIETAQEGIFLIGQDTITTYANQRFSEMIKYSLDNLIGTSIYDFINQDIHKKANVLFNENSICFKGNFEIKFRRRDGTEFWGLMNTNPIFNEVEDFIGSLGMVIDITERKEREEATKKQLLKFNVQEGELYLVTENSPTLSIRAYEDLIKIGYNGLVISRTLEKEFKKNLEVECNFLWLAQKGKNQSIRPELPKIISEIKKQKQKSVILIDRLDYLIHKNGFDDILQFVYELKEIAYLLDLIIIISIDSKTVTDQQLALLTKETKEIKPRSLESVPEEKLEILRFIYKKNNSGLKPSYSDIGTEFNISRPTTRKRLKTLISTGYLDEHKIGIRKILEVTLKGRCLFLD